ncbi:PREDICTED: sucrase-isomaltase, intestinal-like [Myotis davidii]|uniref:sucrase-isomaltase, intestinal-like n=1 Tax=Myotis davidii TaxID=225400 RepID=UPI000766EFF6|nr:PREDICTED: sucrase-isomaltase, intestinal-like [Myotis davidii]
MTEEILWKSKTSNSKSTGFPGEIQDSIASFRLNPFSLIIALDEHGEASGSLFWDDGDSIDSVERGEYLYVEYKFSNRALKATVIKNGYNGITTLAYSTIQILGFTSKPNVIFMNGNTIPSNRMQYSSNGKITLWISAPLSQELTISFEY